MAVKYVIDDETMTAIAEPLRELSGRTDELTPAEMASAGEEAAEEVQTQAALITQIRKALEGKAAGGGGGGITPTGTIQITENGTHDVTNYASAEVNVPSEEPVTEELTVTENGTYTPDSGVDGYSKVTVNVPSSGGDGGGSELVDAILDGSVEEIESNLTTIGERALNYRRKLRKVSLPNVKSIGAYAFYASFASIANSTLFLPELTTAGEYAFCQSGVCTAILPKLKTVSSFMFRYSDTLEKVDLGSATQIQGAAFMNCSELETLIIRTDSVCSLAYITVFNNTPIAEGTGYVYVLSALVDSYKAATNWSTYAAQIRAIEDYPDICGAEV